jgi:chemotaxis protein methyltransferase CheR
MEELTFDPVYARLKQYVIDTTGMAYYAEKDSELLWRLLRRWNGLGIRSCAGYLGILLDPLRGPAEMDALITEITIGETHFFRHREHFDALRDIVLPVLIARNAPQRRLAVWCAGCADGAEPYSLSVLVKREMPHLLAGWDVSILGTDINRQSLSAAREGTFEEWSLRSTSEEFRSGCFLKEGKQWRIQSQYKEGLSFQYHNLVENSFPPPPGGSSLFDLIVCRNVMIYFSPEVMRRLVRQFHECLVPGGWLLVGPSEPNMTYFTSFRVVNAPGVTLYQKAIEPAQTIPQAMPLWPPLPDPPSADSEREGGSFWPADPPKQNAEAKLSSIRQFADRGDWQEAERLCQQWLLTDSLSSVVHFHHALVLEHMGKQVQAEQSFRRAIYLDRRSILAHYHLGLLMRSRGECRQASRCFENTLELLAAAPGDSVLAGADGITVSELRQLARTQIATLGGQA